jgi:hypothetical protein
MALSINNAKTGLVVADMYHIKTGKTGQTCGVTRTTAATGYRNHGNWWLSRDLPRPVAVLGEVICASTRMLLGGLGHGRRNRDPSARGNPQGGQ